MTDRDRIAELEAQLSEARRRLKAAWIEISDFKIDLRNLRKMKESRK